MTRAEADRALLDAATTFGLAAALAVMPRRAAPIVGLAGAIVLSRAHGYALHRLEDTVGRLFDERQSVGKRVDGVIVQVGKQSNRLGPLEGRLGDVELVIAGYHGGVPINALELVEEARQRVREATVDAIERQEAPADLEERRRRRGEGP